jgi:molybdenum cofactor cytidylyltransferase
MIYGVLLAAGESRRFGADKLLHPLPEGTLIAVAAARNLQAAVDKVLAVVRPGSERLERVLTHEGCEVLVCPEAIHGMGASLAGGVRATREAEAWLVALADMPYIPKQTMREIVRLLRAGAPIVAPTWQGKRGHPVGFNARFGEALQALTGDAGARAILALHEDEIQHVAADDAGILRDVDTPADLAGI